MKFSFDPLKLHYSMVLQFFCLIDEGQGGGIAKATCDKIISVFSRTRSWQSRQNYHNSPDEEKAWDALEHSVIHVGQTHAR